MTRRAATLQPKQQSCRPKQSQRRFGMISLKPVHSIQTWCCRCAAFVVAGAILTGSGCHPNKDSDANAGGPATEHSTLDRVTAGPPIRKTLQWFTEQPGRVEAFEETPILSKISGYVETVLVDIGDEVAQGQLLIRIRAPEYQDQLDHKRALLGQAEAQVRQAEASHFVAQAAAKSAQAMVVQAEASIGRSEAEHARWKSEYQRILDLVNKGSVTPKLADETASQYQAAEAARQEALAAIESAKARQHEAEAQAKNAAADIDAAKAKLLTARADIQQAETMLTYTELLSPFAGYVTNRRVDAGHYVQPAGANNARPLMSIANMTKVRVFVNVPEHEATWVDAGFEDPEAGDLVSIHSPSLPSGKIESRVTRTSFKLDPQTRSLTVEIVLDNQDLKFLPGTFVTAKLLLEERKDVLTLPTGAIVKTDEATHCYVVVEGKVQSQRIELGLRVGDEVEIMAGLEGSEKVVLARAGLLQPEQEVEVIVRPGL